DARAGAEQAAIDLYGLGSPEYNAVYEAWNAVGVPSQTALAYAASPLDFEEVYLTYGDTLELNILNMGLGALTITDMLIDNPLFGVDQSNFTINADSNYWVKVHYTPTLVQADSATLSIITATDTLDVQLKGTGIDFPIQVVQPNALSGTVHSGDSLFQSFFIKNTGLGDLNWNLSLVAPLSANVTAGLVAPADSTEVLLTFDASGMIAGNYSYHLPLQSNAPVGGMSSIPYSVVITGTPQIAVVDSIQLGTVYSGVSINKSLWINNVGYDTLRIDSIRCRSAIVELDQYDGQTIAALESTKNRITFTHLPLGAIQDSIHIYSNVGTTVIEVLGTVNPSPIVLSHTSLDFTILSSQSDSAILTLNNVENTAINWNLIPSDTFQLSTTTQPSLHTITKALMLPCFDQFLLSSEWNNFNLAYSDVELDVTTLSNPTFTYQDLVDSGADVLVLGRTLFFPLGSSQIDAIIDYVNAGHGFVAYHGALEDLSPSDEQHRLASLFGLSENVDYTNDNNFDRTSVTTINHEIFAGLSNPLNFYNSNTIVPNVPWSDANLQGKTLATSPDEKAITVSNFNRVYYSDYRHFSGHYPSRRFLRNAIRFADKGLGSVEVNTSSGTLSNNGTIQTTIKMHTKGLKEGNYQYWLNLHHADDDQMISRIPIHLNVIGIPAIETPDSLVFPNTNVGTSFTKNLLIENQGAADLIIDNWVFSGTDFSANETLPITIPPFSTHTLKVNFHPSQGGNQKETLTIMSNDATHPSKVVCLRGFGKEVPQMNVGETAIYVTLVEGDSTTRSINIQNLGKDTLHWNGSSSFMDVMEKFTLPSLDNSWAGAVYLNDQVYIGHYNSGGIYTFDPLTQSFNLAFTIPANRVNRMTSDGSQIYMTVPGFGIYKYNTYGNLTDYFTFAENKSVPITYKDGEIWFSNREIYTSTNIRKMDLSGNTTGTYPISPSDRVQGIDWVNDSTLLTLEFGHPFTLNRYHFDGSQFVKIDTLPQYFDEYGRDLAYQFPNVWATSHDGKLMRIDYSQNAMILSSSRKVLADSTMAVEYQVKTTGLDPGNYLYHLDFTSNDRTMDSLLIPIHLTVLPTPTGNTAPILSLNDVSFIEDDALTINLKQNIDDKQSPFEDLTLNFQVISNQSTEISGISNSDLHLMLVDSTLQLHTTTNINGRFEVEVQVQDPQGLLSIDTMLVDVLAVNDAPSFSLIGNDTIAVNSGWRNKNNFAHAIGDNDYNSQNLQFIISNNQPTLFKTQPTINATGQLSYEVNSNTSGEATVYVTLQDDGGQAYGGHYLSELDSFKIMVPNQIPIIHGAVSQLSTTRNTPLTIGLDDLNVTDVDNVYPNDFSLTVQNGMNYTVAGNTITPALGFLDTLLVPVMVNDGIDNSSPMILKIAVTPSLPVELSLFQAKRLGHKAHLFWTSANEQNNAGFEVERSTTPDLQLSWESIGFQQGAGTTTEARYYTFEDPHPHNTLNYYRLKQIDWNGNLTYSSIEVLDFSMFKDDWVIFPNPANNLLKISSNKVGQVKIQIIDGNGKVLQTKGFLENEVIQLNVSNLPEGQYYLRLIDLTSGHQKSKSVVIARE
ncbi:MAG: choice-of-anchor D domain-containing protein, partial [Bacteroidota bacterium]